jgi:cation diffusion facilitator CzcD-associated flavoprotein CzcO
VHRAALLGLIGSILGRADRKGTSDCADEVTLSLKGAKSPTRDRKLRSTGTKARARVSDEPNSVVVASGALGQQCRPAFAHMTDRVERATRSARS